MRQRIRFHLDEQIDPAIALGLRRHGIDVTTTVEAKLQGQTDSVQLEFAMKQQRVIVTHTDSVIRKITKKTLCPLCLEW